ncbi:MAG TPA: Uma2 family endonuclease [Gemmatimonadaceae bacterium]
MSSDVTPRKMTAEELFGLSIPDKSVELVRGRLVVREPPGFEHAAVAGRLAHLLSTHVMQRALGLVLPEAGYKIFADPDTVRAPDVAFIRSEQIPAGPLRGYAEFAPDLVVEVLSPGDRAGEVLSKIGDWLSAGARLVWVIDPRRRRARVYRADGSDESLGDEDTLNGEDVVPGFVCRLSEVL